VPKLRRLKLADIKLDEKNANRGTKRGREFIEGSLKKYGLGRSILLDKDGHVIAGNKTLEAFRAAGGKEIIVVGSKGDALVAVQREDLTIDSRKGRSLAIADNRASEIDLDWNPEVLASLDLKLDDFFDDRDMRRVMGDFAPEIEAPEPKLDQALELAKKWKTKIGQLWNIGPHRLYCGDCTQEGSWAAVMGGIRATIAFTDPPWNVAIGQDSNPRHRQRAGLQNDSLSAVDFQHSSPRSPHTWPFIQLAICTAFSVRASGPRSTCSFAAAAITGLRRSFGSRTSSCWGGANTIGATSPFGTDGTRRVRVHLLAGAMWTMSGRYRGPGALKNIPR
jgi:hypothetical protein